MEFLKLPHFFPVFQLVLYASGFTFLVGCQPFQRSFSQLGFTCGFHDGQELDSDQNFMVRLQEVDGSSSPPTRFRAERIRSDGVHEELAKSSKGCLIVPKSETQGIRAWSTESLSFASLDVSELLTQATLPQVQTMKLQRLPKLTGMVDCHDKTVWTRRGFASTVLKLGLVGEESSGSLKDLMNFLPALDVGLTVKSSASEVYYRQRVSGVSLRQLALVNNILRFDFQVPEEDEAQLEFQIKDVFERSIIAAEGQCRIKSTSKPPPLYSSYEEAEQTTLPLNGKIDIGVPDGFQLKMKVQLLQLGEKTLRWDQLSKDEQDKSRRDFSIQKSFRFVTPGSFVVWAFSEDPAGNQSDIWERLIQVPESYKHDNQWDLYSWSIPNFGPKGELALFSVRDLVEGKPTGSVAYPESGDEILRKQTLSWSDSAFFKGDLRGKRLKLVYGNFGIKGHTGQQVCLSVGPYADELSKTGRTGSIICAERAGNDRMETLLDLPFPSLLDDEDLTAIDIDADGFEDMVSYSSSRGLTKYWTFTKDELIEKTNQIALGNVPQGFPSAQKIFAFCRHRMSVDTADAIPDVLEFDPKVENLSYTYYAGVQPTPGSFGHWYGYKYESRFASFQTLTIRLEPPSQKNSQSYWTGSIMTPRTSLQMTESFKVGQSIFSFYDAMTGRYRFWERFDDIWQPALPGFLPSDTITGKGLDVDRNQHCFFYRRRDSATGSPRCVAFANEMGKRNSISLFSFDGDQWQRIGKSALKQEPDFGEFPKPIGGIARLGRQQAFELRGDGIHHLQWEVISLSMGQRMPDKTDIDNALDRRVGEGSLKLWGIDERFAVFFRYIDPDNGLSSAWQKRDVRFPPTIARQHNLSRRLGWADLYQDGQLELIEPGTEPGTWNIHSLNQDSEFNLKHLKFQADWPTFLNPNLQWNSRLISVVSGQFLGRGLPNLYCYVAHASQRAPIALGSIACYRLAIDENSRRWVKQFEKELNIAENEQIFTFDTAGDNRTVIGAFNFTSFTFRVFALSDSGTFDSHPLIMSLPGYPQCFPTFPASLAIDGSMFQNPGEATYAVVASNPSGGEPILYMFNSFSTAMVAKPLYKSDDRYCTDDNREFRTTFAVFFENAGLYEDPMADMKAANFVQSFPATSLKSLDSSKTGGAVINSDHGPRIWTAAVESYNPTFPLAATHSPFYYVTYSNMTKSDILQVLAMPNSDQIQQPWVVFRYDASNQQWKELSRFQRSTKAAQYQLLPISG